MALPASPFKNNGERKSFWERPEGTTGIFTIGALTLGGFALVKIFGDLIISTLDTAIGIVGKGMVLGGMVALASLVVFTALNPKVHALIGYAFKLVMRKLTGWIVEIDPIGIMRIYIEDLKKRMNVIDDRLNNLSGQIRSLKETIKKNAQAADTALTTFKGATEGGKKVLAMTQAKQVDRLSKTNMRYDDVLKKMEFLKIMLGKYREAAEATILDLQNEVDVQEVERKSMLAAYGAMTAVRDILNGGGDKRELFDQAMEFAVNDYGMKIGEIENFMDTSQSFLEGLDLSDATANSEALARLQEWENKADSLLLGNAKETVLQSLGAQPVQVQPATVSYLRR
jgi:HPt (histidine-containing phosphotransfer) domain-containing protein